ncbi:hypothetical protein BDM02DRAFT_267265 [Thelephora ganbajun]|uniref:Uncharacterized protein n=1 Tax=Thelephora ganbajun TaxID=370292 RepID=A0ACB6Z993_THEGA|nr:hypothetical protein BDM02DRAFT_267265 [Thelephora ganbajun]
MRRRGDTSQQGSTPQQGTKRINMDTFKRLMDPTADLDNFAVGCGDDEEHVPGDSRDEGVEESHYHWLFDLPTVTLDADLRSPIPVFPIGPPPTQGSDSQLGGIEEEEEWRPMSPVHGGIGLDILDIGILIVNLAGHHGIDSWRLSSTFQRTDRQNLTKDCAGLLWHPLRFLSTDGRFSKSLKVPRGDPYLRCHCGRTAAGSR